MGRLEMVPRGDHGRSGLRAAQLATSATLVLLLQSAAAAEVPNCQTWRSSHGLERIRLGNQLGEAHYLTKNRLLQTSPEQAPISLYRPSDLRRLCEDR